ncbi:cation:proton antiporter [Microbulbifer hainanensis]|uniref:cation:proton antiporter n=1 Tax=Microbulbifer hainanensis TaxID=2735675 RepID=UPI0018684090|nr:cation:proton antiporter [Microbulbifer hainanensis]
MESITTLVGQGLYMAAAAVAGLGLARILRSDNTLGCFIAGVVAGMLLPLIDYNTSLRAEHLHQLVFFVILPILIFESAWEIEPRELKEWLGPLLLMATLGVGICALLIAVLIYFGVNEPETLPWQAALLTGAILAATNPGAVVTKLRQKSGNEDLLTLIKGESLFNDVAAIVLFTLVLGAVSHSVFEGAVSTGEPLEDARTITMYFAVTVFGGLAVGVLCGLLTAIVVLLLGAAGAALVTLLFAALGTYYLAEHVVHVSGIVAVMVCAMVARACLREQRETYLAHVSPTWEWLGLLFRALIFVIMGLVITPEMIGQQWFAILIAIAAAVGARALSIFVTGPLARFVGPPIPRNWRLLLGWGGLRGVIAVALALSLPSDLPFRLPVQSMVFGVVLFSLLVQGTSSRWLLGKLRDED